MLERRAWTFRNLHRMNMLLELVRLRVNGQSAYNATTREHLAADGGAVPALVGRPSATPANAADGFRRPACEHGSMTTNDNGAPASGLDVTDDEALVLRAVEKDLHARGWASS
jgi:hypothetical protein